MNNPARRREDPNEDRRNNPDSEMEAGACVLRRPRRHSRPGFRCFLEKSEKLSNPFFSLAPQRFTPGDFTARTSRRAGSLLGSRLVWRFRSFAIITRADSATLETVFMYTRVRLFMLLATFREIGECFSLFFQAPLVSIRVALVAPRVMEIRYRRAHVL